MQTQNLTHPGVQPVDGDQIRNTYPNGMIEEKYYSSPPAVPVPAPVRVLQKIDFLKRFTQAERIAIRAAAVTNPVVNDFVQMQDAAQTIDLADPLTIADMNAIEAAGLIAVGRSAAILA